MNDDEQRWVTLLASLVLEVQMARTDDQLRHFVRQLESACQAFRVVVWAEDPDVSEAISLAAGERP